MTRKTTKTDTKAGSNESASLDLRIRLSDDGGPLFRALMQLGNSHVRGERVRQLMYLGFIRELELSVRSVDVALTPLPSRTAHAQSASSSPKPIVLEVVEEPAGTVFDAGDLTAVFG